MVSSIKYLNYSERQWGIAWKKLPKSISSRVPTRRKSFDDRYSLDKYQGIPEKGYTEMMNNMLYGIKVNLGVKKNEYKKLKCDKMIYTGKPDEFFDLKFGKLPYRSLKFKHYKAKRTDLFSFDKGAQINECGDKTIKYNRTVDNSVFLNQKENYTILTRDYPEEHNQEIYNKYKEAIRSEKNVIFLGRLATYKYMDMWVTIKQAINKLT